jgi:hypothetical protein
VTALRENQFLQKKQKKPALSDSGLPSSPGTGNPFAVLQKVSFLQTNCTVKPGDINKAIGAFVVLQDKHRSHRQSDFELWPLDKGQGSFCSIQGLLGAKLRRDSLSIRLHWFYFTRSSVGGPG